MTKREAAMAEMHEAYKKRYDDCTPREKKLRDCDVARIQYLVNDRLKRQEVAALAK